MEEIRKAALAYRDNMSNIEIFSATSIFLRLDTNRDEKISVNEFSGFLSRRGCPRRFCIDFSKKLDEDNDGFLDVKDFTVFWYLLRSKRLVYCDGCGDFLDAVYFTCVKCFISTTAERYDLCYSCYRVKNLTLMHDHEGALFCDHHAVLEALEVQVEDFQSKAFKAIRKTSEMMNIYFGYRMEVATSVEAAPSECSPK